MEQLQRSDINSVMYYVGSRKKGVNATVIVFV